MSGAEAGLVLGLISSIISIVDASKKIFDAAKDTKGLPGAFREVAGRLPIIRETLNSTEQIIKERELNDGSCEGVKHVVKTCEEKAERLKELFREAIPAEGASDLKRYYKAVKALGKGGKVENLMKGMLEDVQLLAGENGMNTATKAQQDHIIQAIAVLEAVPPSVPEHEFQKTCFTNSNYGSGTQYNAQGENIAQGSAQQYNSAGGEMNFGDIYNNTQYVSNPRPNEDEAQACLNALFLTNPRDDRAQLTTDKGSRVDGTCKWIKSHSFYRSWLRSHSQLLWLSGGPGKGKTMLSIFLAEELEETAVSQNKLFLQYFCDNKDEKRNTAVAVLRGLIYQLLQSRPKLFDHILPTFRTQKASLFSFETLWRIFESMVHDPTLETTYWVLDGVDECDEASVEILLGKFAALFSTKTNKSSPCHLNLLIVSRGLPDCIPNLLSSFPRISLDPDASAEVRNDINIFIEAKVEELSKYRQYSEPLRVHVAKVFRDRAGGTFLWIGIVAKTLRKYKSTEVENALDLFPPGLDQLYARILLQIDSRRRDTAARILRWVVMAVRPLTLSELSLAIEPTVDPSIIDDRDERIRDQVSYCGDFLVIKDYREFREDGEDGGVEEGEVEWVRVALIHQSAGDYLLRKNKDPNPVLEDFRVKEDLADHEIAKRCLEYLQSGALDYRRRNISWLLKDAGHLRAYPLLSYAALQWHEHARYLARSADIFDLSKPLWKKDSEIRTSWFKAYWKFELRYLYGHDKPPESFSKLHLASFLGIFSLVEKLVLGEGWVNKIKRMLFLNKVDSHGMTALMWAAWRGHDAVVRLLLEKGAHPEMKGKYQGTALTIAVECGHEAIVQLLLEKGANVDAEDLNRETALMKAANWGGEDVVHLLLDYGPDIKVQDRHGWTVLMSAAGSGSEAVTQLLLEQGADVKFQNRYGETALMKAAEWGHEVVIQLLLAYGANFRVQNRFGETALMKAAKQGYMIVIRLLLEQGADVNGVDRFGKTALMNTVERRSERGSKVDARIIEKRYDISTMDGDPEATSMGTIFVSPNWNSEATIRLLLENGADINAVDKDGETVLMKAARGESYDSVASIRLLLEQGADITAERNDGETALAIAKRGREDVLLYSWFNESERQRQVRKPNLDSIIQMLTFHSQTQSSI